MRLVSLIIIANIVKRMTFKGGDKQYIYLLYHIIYTLNELPFRNVKTLLYMSQTSYYTSLRVYLI